MHTSSAQFHSFNVELAAAYGVHEAILIHHFQYWINHNKRLGRNERDGRTWTYQTRAEIAAWFPYLTEKQARTLTDRLVEKGVLVKGQYAKNNHDRTLWYAFKDEEAMTLPPRDLPKWANGISHLGKCTLATDTVTNTAAAAEASPLGVADGQGDTSQASHAPLSSVDSLSSSSKADPGSNKDCVGNVHNPFPPSWAWLADDVPPKAWDKLLALLMLKRPDPMKFREMWEDKKAKGVQNAAAWLVAALRDDYVSEWHPGPSRDPAPSKQPYWSILFAAWLTSLQLPGLRATPGAITFAAKFDAMGNESVPPETYTLPTRSAVRSIVELLKQRYTDERLDQIPADLL